jgi:hypothetical protein
MAISKTYDEWVTFFRTQPKHVVSSSKDYAVAFEQQAALTVWSEMEAAEAQKIRDAEFQRTSKIKQEREAEHNLWTYWCLADWGERFGMISFLFGVLVVGYLCASNHIISRIIALFRDVKP